MTSLNESIEFSSDPGDAGYIQSTPFNISQPGLFFNQAQARSFDEAVHQQTVMSLTNNTEAQTKLQLLSSPPWIDIRSDFSGEYVPVACVSGATDDPNPAAMCAQNAYCLGSNQSPIGSNYIRCIRTSLDSVGGSSGGAMLMAPPHFSESDGSYYRNENHRHAYGVLNGASDNEGMTDGWGTDSKVDTDNGFPTSEGFTLVTVGNADYERWGRRTTTFNGGTDLFNPGPLQPATDNSPPCEPMASGGCVFSLPQSNPIWGTPEVGAPVLDFKDSAPSNDVDTESIRLSCDYGRYYGDRILNQTFRTKAGVAVGLIGTSTQSYLTAETAVASLGVICAPWSTASWSDNWNWLLKHMRHLQGGGNARENSVWQPILRLALPFMSEWRRETPESAPYVRPMSMKLCPPNYVIKGVGLWHDEETLLGITKLLCQNPQGQRHDALLQPLEGPATNLAWRYTFKGRAFSIAQHIGNASGSRGYYEELECGQGQVVGGIQLSKSSNTPVRSLWLECIAAPGSL